MHEYLENKTQKAGDSFSDSDIREFEMAKIKRPYTVNGVSVWIVGNSEQEIADKYADLKNGSVPLPQPKEPKHNFAKFAKDNWQYITQTVSKRTAKDYMGYMKNQILPYFGYMNIEDIDWRDIQGFYDKNAERSFSTVHKFRVVISRLMQIAVGDGLIHTDPTKDKRLSYTKRKSIRPVPNTETYKELLSSIDSLEEHHERLYMAILGYTGLRKGEILALKWNDISLKESLIHVKRSIVIAGTSILS